MKKNIFRGFTAAIVFSFLLQSPNITSGEGFHVTNSKQNFSVGGQAAHVNALNINGSNYIKVAELAELLDIDIEFDETSDTVALDKGKPFTGVRIKNPVAPPEIKISANNNTIAYAVGLNTWNNAQYGAVDKVPRNANKWYNEEKRKGVNVRC